VPTKLEEMEHFIFKYECLRQKTDNSA